jgi:hypothetical protein
MALGLGEGGEQNAPLGRAVIGGLLLATVATLLFVRNVNVGDLITANSTNFEMFHIQQTIRCAFISGYLNRRRQTSQSAKPSMFRWVQTAQRPTPAT